MQVCTFVINLAVLDLISTTWTCHIICTLGELVKCQVQLTLSLSCTINILELLQEAICCVFSHRMNGVRTLSLLSILQVRLFGFVKLWPMYICHSVYMFDKQSKCSMDSWPPCKLDAFEFLSGRIRQPSSSVDPGTTIQKCFTPFKVSCRDSKSQLVGKPIAISIHSVSEIAIMI